MSKIDYVKMVKNIKEPSIEVQNYAFDSNIWAIEFIENQTEGYFSAHKAYEIR